MTIAANSKENLIEELVDIRQRIDRLEASGAKRQQAQIQRDHILATEREQRALTEALHWAGAVLGSTLNYDKVLDHIMEQIGRVIAYKAACIMLVEGKSTQIFRWRGYTRLGTAGSVMPVPFELDHLPTLRTIQGTGWPLVTPFVTEQDEWVTKTGESWIKSYLNVPIRTRIRLLGFLHVDSDTPGFYSQADAERLQAFANQAAAALSNARRYDQARQEIARRVKDLKKERNFVSTILDTAGALVVVCDQEGRVVRFNRACERTTGYVVDEVRGKKLWNLLLPAEEVKVVKAIIADVENERCPNSHEHHWITKNGQPRLISWSNTVLLDNEGLVEYIVSTGIDITERKQAEEEREKLIQELDAFAHTVAHDLQTLLTRIVGFADLLEESCVKMPPETLQEHLKLIARNGRKMSNVISELLLLAGVRKKEVKLKPLDMASIVAEAQQRLSDVIEEHQAEIILPEAWLPALGYGPWVEEVWVNYLSNAVKYGGKPPRVELGSTVQADGQVRFWVGDNGPGLTPEDQARLFTPYTRLNEVRASGQGLGLSIVRRIAEKLGGEVGVESEGVAGQGSVFSFTLARAGPS